MIYNNKNIYPKVFIAPTKAPDSSNQNLYRTNYITQFIEQQQTMNKKMSCSFKDMNQHMLESKLEHKHYFDKMLSQISKQEDSHQHFTNRMENQENASQSILARVQQLERLNYEIKNTLEGDGLVNQAIMDQLSAQDHFSQEISNKLKENDKLLESINSQLKKQEELYESLTEKLSLQDVYHQTVMDRLESQEALVQKVTRQLDNLKGIIFERFSNLSEKVENSLKSTSNFLFRFITKDDEVYKNENKIEEIEKVHKE